MGIAFFDSLYHMLLSGHTTAKEYFLTGVAALSMGQCAQIAKYSLLRMFADGACVHNNYICAFGFLYNGIAALDQKASDFFGVSLVLLTAIGFHIGQGSGVPIQPILANMITKSKLLFQ